MLLTALFEQPVLIFLWTAAIVFALTIHEFSHALSGKLQGDPTAELEGRLTLNPLAHIDWLGFFLLFVAGFGWAKPTPFNPYNLKFRKFGPALVALAGPISNILAAIVFGLALRVISIYGLFPPENLLVVFLIFLMQINILLAAFNFIPIPPLDGSKVLFSLIQDKNPEIVAFMERYGLYMLLALVFLGGDFLDYFFTVVYNFAFGILL